MNTQDQHPVKHFDSLLEWFDPDRERAAEKYVRIRQSLVKIFTWSGVADAESLANETLDRVGSRVSEVRAIYKGDPSIYVYGVAKNVLIELRRAQDRSVKVAAFDPESRPTDIDEERIYSCMERCFAELSSSSRTLIADYYGQERTESQLYREELAKRLRIAPHQLRLRVFRIREKLKTCLEACMKQDGKH